MPLPRTECNTSRFFRDPVKFYDRLYTHMRTSALERTSTTTMPHTVLSAGCGEGREAISIVVTWLMVLEDLNLAKEEFPLQV